MLVRTMQKPFCHINFGLIYRKSTKINPEKDYYKLLNLDSYAQEEEIKQAYKNQAKKSHPDINKQNSEIFQEINEAYEVLSNNISRRQYDRLREEYVSRHAQIWNQGQQKQKQRDIVMQFLSKNFNSIFSRQQDLINNFPSLNRKKNKQTQIKKTSFSKVPLILFSGGSLLVTLVILQQITKYQSKS